MRDRLKSLIDTFFCCVDIDKFYIQNQKEKLTDYLRENGVIIPPCKIGDEAWIIRNYRGVPTPQKGIVSSISFNDDMELAIAVKHIGRGRWGKNIFPTYEDAIKAIGGGK